MAATWQDVSDAFKLASAGLNSIPVEKATTLLRDVKFTKTELQDAFISYLEVRDESVSQDTLRGWFDLSKDADSFEKLEEIYRTDEAWPSVVDDFIADCVKPLVLKRQAIIPRPHTGPEEATAYRTSLKMSLPMKEGQQWYVVEANWFHKWCDYSGYHEVANRDPTVAHFEIPIDNTPLLEGGTLPRSKHESQDFVLIPEACWDMLFSWYGGGPALPRTVFLEGYYKDPKVEVWPYRLKLRFRRDDPDRKIEISRTAKLQDLRDRAHDLFDIQADVKDVLLYDEYNYAVNNMDQTLANSVFTDDRVVIVRVRQAGGVTSGSSLSSTYQTAAAPQNVTPGLCGLQNIGNTCFMNSALQCLSHTPLLREHFLSRKYESEINEVNPLGTKGALARAFAHVLSELWSGKVSSHRPSDFKMVLARFAPQFSGWQQQDSQELLAFLLDGIHEDLNRVLQKEFVEKQESDGRPDVVVAEESWEKHLKRNRSVIVDLFHGQLKSTIECPDCDKISITFDPFMYLSLPLQVQPDSSILFDVAFFPANDPYTSTVKYRIKVSDAGSAGDILREVSKLTGASKGSILLADVFSHKVHAFLENFKGVGDISQNDTLVAYECPLLEDAASSVDKRKEHVKITLCHECGPYAYGLLPVALVLKKTTTNKELFEQVWDRVKPLAPDFVPTEEKPYPFKIRTESYYCDICKNSNCRSCPVQPTSDSLLTMAATSLEPVKSQYYYYRKDYVTLFVIWDPGYVTDKAAWPMKDHESLDSAQSETKERKKCKDLGDCMTLFSSKEKLGENDMWYCPQCKDHKQASKQMELWKLPEYLVVHMKRFSYTTRMGEKLDHLIKFPLRDFDVSPWMVESAPRYQGTIYDLYAISNHSGGTYGGHYTAYALANEKWMDFNDSWVSAPYGGPEAVVSSQAYLLFYKRRRPEGVPPPVPAVNPQPEAEGPVAEQQDNIEKDTEMVEDNGLPRRKNEEDSEMGD